MTATLLAVAAPVAAADKDGVYAIHRGINCWSYLVWKDTGNGTALGLVDAWVAGYITAYNRQAPDTMNILGGTSMESAMRWLEQWCRANPKSDLDAGMSALITAFHAGRHKSAKEARRQ